MNHFIAEVRNLKDPWESGRVQIRIYGDHDDEQNIKDEDLLWAMVAMPVTSASTNKIGTSPTGLLVGSRVIGYFLDDAHQQPIITGSFHRAGKQKDENDNTKGFDDIDDQYSDVPTGALGSKKRTNKTNKRAKKLTNQQPNYDAKNPPKYNKNDYEDHEGEDALEASRKKNAPKTYDLPTIGSVDKGQLGSILGLINKIDSGNEAGGLGAQAPQLFQQLLQMNSMSSMSGLSSMAGGSFGGMLSGIASMAGFGGLENLMGQLSGMLGGMISGGGGGGGNGGSGFGGTGGSGSTIRTTGGVITSSGTTAPLYEILSSGNFTDDEFVVRLYEITLGREPDTNGFVYWMSQLAKKVSRLQVVAAFLEGKEYSQEFTDDTSFINSLYTNVLNRSPDPGGATYWLEQLSKNTIVPDDTKLTMAQSTSNSVTAPFFLKAAFRIILERAPDTDGYNYWLSQTSTPKSTVIEAFFTSTEYLTKYSDPATWVNKLYEKLLGRTPDVGGYQYCIGQINQDPTSTLIKQQLVSVILNSTEFKNLASKPYASIKVAGNGVSRTQVIESFLNSKEFSNDFYKYQLNSSTTALVAADLLNQLKGFSTPSTQIGGMTVQQREVLYNALLTLFNNTYIPVAQKMNMGQIVSETVHNVDFLIRLYQLVLGRKYDNGGLQYWLTQIQNGLARTEIIVYFFSSDEYNKKYPDNKNFVTSLYEKILNREPDPTGLIYWSDLLITKTLTRSEVVHYFIYNDEFASLNLRNTRFLDLNSTVLADIMSSSVNNTDFVIRLYRIFLKREPDTEGLAYWVNQLENGLNRIDVVIEFCDSIEYTDLYTKNLDFITSLYVNILNRKPATAASNSEFITRTYNYLYVRDPSADEMSYWIDRFNSGLSKIDFLTNFINNEELERVNPEYYASSLVTKTQLLNNSDFATQVYQNIYHRKITDSELKIALQKLSNGVTRNIFILSILNEIKGTQPFNPNNYNTDVPSVLFRLTVAFNEQDYWEDLLSEGELNRAQVVECFLKSQEFLKLEFNSGNVVIDDSKIAGLITNPPLVVQMLNNSAIDATSLIIGQLMTTFVSNTDFIIRIYEILMGREYDEGGFEYWSEAMASGVTKTQVLILFFESTEYTTLYPSDVAFVTSLYVKLLNRQPDQEGLQYWVNYLKEHPTHRGGVAYNFIISPEFLSLELDPSTTAISSISTGSFTEQVMINDYPTTITVSIVNGQPTVPDATHVPDGYFQVFTYTDYDPYPGFIRWEGPNGEILYSLRPANQPYVATPSEDAINHAIIQIMNDLLNYVNTNTLTLEILLQLLDITFDTVKTKAEQNVLGNNINVPNSQHGGGPSNAMMNILGILGQLMQLAQSLHLPESVLNMGNMQEILSGRGKDQAMLKMKKKIAKQAVSQKNEMQSMNPNQLLGFGNMAKNFAGKGGSNGSSQNQPNYGNGGTGGGGTGAQSGAPANNVIHYTTTIGGRKINVTSINGRSVIDIKDLPNGYMPVDVNTDPNFIKWMLLNNSNVANQQVPFFTLKTTQAIARASIYLPANVIANLKPVSGDVLSTNIGGAYHVGFYPIIS